MSTTCNVAILVGSLRKESWNLKLASALGGIAPESMSFSILDYSQLPHFNQDWEAEPPQTVRDFRRQITIADAILFVTPEYNRSIPGILKNAIDVGSRPYGEGAFMGKPGAVISSSIGPMGGFGANHHLRQVLTAVGVNTMAQPEAYIGNIASIFDDKGTLTDASTIKFISKFLDACAGWIERNPSR